MATTLEYLDWRGDLSFLADPLNEIDSFLMTQISYPDLTGIVSEEAIPVGDALERYFAQTDKDVNYFGVISSDILGPALARLPEHPRFSALRLKDFQLKSNESRTEQFSAVSILLPDGSVYISFRGTDDTISAWKENFLLALSDTIPAQRDALQYLEQAASACAGPLIVGGHSKGGNLAVYAAAMADPEIQDRISAVYNFDGPGFNEAFFRQEGYLRVRPKIHNYLSQHSIVGVLLPREQSVEIVDSKVPGPLAHDGFRWRVMGPRFLRCEAFTRSSRAFEEAMHDVLDGMSIEARAAFINELFDMLYETGARTLTDLKKLKPQKLLALAVKQKPEVQSFVRKLVEQTLREYLVD